MPKTEHTEANERARAAASRGDWPEAFSLYMTIEADGLLHADELSVLGEVAYAAGHLDIAISAWERVHGACGAVGDRVGAAAAATRVAMHLLFDTALMAPVRGWLAEADRLLVDEADSPAHAWSAVVRAYERLLSGDFDAARQSADLAVTLGAELDPAAAAIGRLAVARLSILDGDVDAGLRLLEQVGVDATSGGLDPLSTGVVYCELVCALHGAAQYDLAEEWTEAMERWCGSHAIGSLHGRCRVHRAEILRLRGRCTEAEQEALAACEELRPYLRRELGWPLAELGQIRLRLGDLDGAERALVEAHLAGWDPQPGMANVRLARGAVDDAVAAIRDALDRPFGTPSKERPPNNALHRAPLLVAQVDIEVEGGDLDRARAAAGELSDIAERFRSRALSASAEHALGRVRQAEHAADAARAHFAAAAQIWSDIGAPFELGVARRWLGEAHTLLGRRSEAELEFEAARSLLARVAGEQRARVADHRSPPVVNSLVRDGDDWTFAFGGTTVRVRDRRGVHYLRHLLAQPGREFHVLDLVNMEHGVTADRNRAHLNEIDAVDGDAVELLDDQARSAYRRRLAEIDDDIDEAHAVGDIGRAEQAENEREFLIRELSRAFGLGGRSRKSGAASERARAAVTRAIRTAIARIDEHDHPLGLHLRHAVRTGTYCSYQPDPASPMEWQL